LSDFSGVFRRFIPVVIKYSLLKMATKTGGRAGVEVIQKQQFNEI